MTNLLPRHVLCGYMDPLGHGLKVFTYGAVMAKQHCCSSLLAAGVSRRYTLNLKP